MRLLVLLVILSVVLSNAQQNDDKKNKSFSHSILNFHLKLLLYEGNPFKQEFLLAPFSAWALMAVLAEGTLGETDRELRTYMGNKVSKEISREGFANVTQFLQQRSSVTVERTSALFHDLNVTIKPDYLKDVTKYYGTNVVEIDTSQPEAIEMKVNEYFENKTHFRFFRSNSTFMGTQIILSETLYFKGSWTKPFNVSATAVENFYDDAYHILGKVNMMRQRAPLGLINMEKIGGHVIELQYGDREQFVMLVMLPYHGVKIFALFISMTNQTFVEIFQRLAQDKLNYGTADVDVWLSRFKLNIEANLEGPGTTLKAEVCLIYILLNIYTGIQIVKRTLSELF